MLLPLHWLSVWVAFYAICMSLTAVVLLKCQKATDFERLFLLLQAILASLGVGGFAACHIVYWRLDAEHGAELYILISDVLNSTRIWILMAFTPTIIAATMALQILFSKGENQSQPTGVESGSK